MQRLKTLVGIFLIVVGTTAVAVGQDLAPWPAQDNYAQKGKGGGDVRRGDRQEKKGGTGTDGGRPRSAPEIDGASAIGALALLSGVLLIFRRV
jgi:hypothetical protein